MVLGKVPEEVCVKLIDKYQAEHKTLQAELDTVRARLDTINKDECDVDEFIRRLKSMQALKFSPVKCSLSLWNTSQLRMYLRIATHREKFTSTTSSLIRHFPISEMR